MALFLAVQLGQPVLLEGEPGVGKTTAAKALAAALAPSSSGSSATRGSAPPRHSTNGTTRARCLASASPRPEPRIAALDRSVHCRVPPRPAPPAGGSSRRRRCRRCCSSTRSIAPTTSSKRCFSSSSPKSSVTVPELGTFTAAVPPIVVLTSNRSRELHDALKRRCYYHWIEYPGIERSADIVRRRVPTAASDLVSAATAFVSSARGLDLDKPPGLAEAIDWVTALQTLGVTRSRSRRVATRSRDARRRRSRHSPTTSPTTRHCLFSGRLREPVRIRRHHRATAHPAPGERLRRPNRHLPTRRIMILDNEFRVSVPIERAWEVLTDIPLITPCLPEPN